ncbi:RWD domain-containing protein 1, partial [Spiromyces aspiralis]
MTDYHREEQQNEIEVLQSIYMDELTSSVRSEFTFTPMYPDELPIFFIENADTEEGAKRLDPKHLYDLTDVLTKIGEESLGMAMIFTMLTTLREGLTDILNAQAEEKRQAEAARQQAEIEKERQKYI